MSRECMKVTSVVCRIVLVLSNTILMVSSILSIIVGCCLIFGFRLVTSLMGDQIEDWTSSFTSKLRDAGLGIDILVLLNDIGAVTMGIGVTLLLLGLLLLAISCFGCYGGGCGITGCLLVYSLLMLLLFIAQLVLVIIWFTDSEVIKANAKPAMEASLQEYLGFNGTNVQSVLQNAVQIFANCCGVTNGSDFNTMAPKWQRLITVNQSGFVISFNLTYPITCCKFNMTTFSVQDESCLTGAVTEGNSNFKKGCYTKIFDFVKTYFDLNSPFYALAAMLLLQAALIIAASFVVCAARNKSTVAPQKAPAQELTPGTRGTRGANVRWNAAQRQDTIRLMPRVK